MTVVSPSVSTLATAPRLPELSRSPPYVFNGDGPHIEAFNATLGVAPDYNLCTELIPEPVLGRRDAPVVVLARNPSWGPDDEALHRRWPYRDALRANLGSDPAGHVMPHLRPEPEFQETHSGRWWRQRTNRLAKLTGVDLSRRICAVEFHGYHARKFRPLPITLPSQRYGFSIVAAAIERGALVVITRADADWCIAVPELRSYSRAVRMRSGRSIWFTPGCLESGGFEQLVEALR
jgi:hypothetical protein